MTTRCDHARFGRRHQCAAVGSLLLALSGSGIPPAQALYLPDLAADDSGELQGADPGPSAAPQGATAGQSQDWRLVSQDAGFAMITSAQLAAMLERKDFLLVNVHIPYEGEIAGTDAFIPYDKIAGNLDKLPKDRSARIVLYCRSGRMSGIAARELASLGYTQVSDLAGGMIDWKESGYELIER